MSDPAVRTADPDPPTVTGGTSSALTAHGLVKRYVGGDGRPLQILGGVDLEVTPSETVAVIGESGAGKSTLLHLLGGLDRPTAGDVSLGGRSLSSLPEAALARLRNDEVGFVFQFHHLLREFTALENVMMPALIAGTGERVARERAHQLLREVGLGMRIGHKPTQLSGGEQQRVAVARALANRPLVLLADEPTGNLDTHTSERLHELLFAVTQQHGTSMVLVTHDRALAARCDRVPSWKRGDSSPARRARRLQRSARGGDACSGHGMDAKRIDRCSATSAANVML